MANQEHLNILKEGVKVWNKWREEYPDFQPDFSNADLIGADLREANLSNADFSEAFLADANLWQANLRRAFLREANLGNANLSEATLSGAILGRAYLSEANLRNADLKEAYLGNANLSEANLSEANLSRANLSGADLWQANFRNTDLTRADLIGADLTRADLSYANLSYADLAWSNISEANCREANLTGCNIYAISAWNVHLQETIQTDLIITRDDEAIITVDNLEVAQFIYLLLNNEKIRHVIDTITSKVVLILGSFTPERKVILDAIKDELHERNYTPVLFDFEKPASRDLTETVTTLARLARFIIADITDAKSIIQELSFIVPHLPSLPVQPVILSSQHEYGMFEHFTRYPWVLPLYRYTDEISLLQSLQEKVITPAEQKAKELEIR